MKKSTPIYKFATLRNPSDIVATNDHQIKQETTLSLELKSINQSDIDYKLKMDSLNAKIQGFIDTSDYIRTKEDFENIKNEVPSESILNVLFDNIIVRTLTKCTTNLLFKLITAHSVYVFKKINSIPDEEKCRIIIPEGLAIAINEAPKDAEEPDSEPIIDQKAIIKEINMLSEFEQKISRAKVNNVISFNSDKQVVRKNVEHQSIILAFKKSNISLIEVQEGIAQKMKDIATDETKTRVLNQDYEKLGPIESNIKAQSEASTIGVLQAKQHYQSLSDFVQKSKNEGVTEFTENIVEESTDFDDILTYFKKKSLTISEAEKLVKESMLGVSSNIQKITPVNKFSFMGDKWVETTNIANRKYTDYSGGINSQSANCNTKIPYLIADLKVVEQTTVGYLPGEIASINNTQAGEKNTRVTRRLKTVDSYESLINEETTFQETDTQSTDRTSISSEASKIQDESNSFSINASAAASYGPVSASIDTGYSNSDSTTNANTSSIYQAKEVVQSIVNSVTNRVYSERSTRTIEEFEETVTHVIDNSTTPTQSYVYRWLDKLVRAKLINYGKRLIFQFDIAHPSHYYLAQVIKQNTTINLPPDPRKNKIDGNPVLTIDNISRDNYLVWASIYKADVEQAPTKKIIISEVLNGTGKASTGKLIPIKKDYECFMAKVTASYHNGEPYGNFMYFIIGNGAFACWNEGPDLWHPYDFYLRNETDQLPVSVLTANVGFIINIEIECNLTEIAYKEWRINTYNAIIEGYEKLKSDVEEAFISFNPNMPGLNPSQKLKIIKDELKKETIKRMSKCNPFWINDKYIVGQEYNQNCCLDKTHGEKIRFLETTFDWENMTYEFHPYYYSDKNNWLKMLALTDSDPHFESFLQASFSTIRVPVHRDNLKEIAALNFLYNNSIANYEVLPENLQPIIEELKDGAVTNFTEDENGQPIEEPISEKDLGVFNIPTSLVILEYGVSDGVKLRGYPEDATAPTSDVIIPKQYSPAIISEEDSYCLTQTTNKMAKLKIEELKYIVMEGGGARGTAYLGAVKALEDQLKELVESDTKGVYEKAKVDPKRDGQYGIMDYLEIKDNNKKPIIKGVAGASAGAITTFALVLGLNSKEIEDDVMSYSFESFLKETDPGKYRMIDNKSALAIGEDKSGGNSLSDSKIVGGKCDPFHYTLSKDKTSINGNILKGTKRFFYVNLITKILLDGIIENLNQIESIFNKNNSKSWSSKLLNWFFKLIKKDKISNKSNTGQFVGSSVVSLSITNSLFLYLSKKINFKITPNTISGIFNERGLYSGFQVREFFYDLILCAVTRDTFFQRKLIEYYKKTFNVDFDKNLLSNKFKIGERKQYYTNYVKNNNELTDLFEFLMNLTFIELYQILEVDFCVSVSNFTSGSPLYYSYSFTPHFRVLEAVAASMSIPPAIRPVYNESNVIANVEKYETISTATIYKVGKKSIIDRIKFDTNEKLPFFINGKFDRKEYLMYEQAVKKFLQSKIKGVSIDLNNKIDLSNFMFKFRDLVIGKWDNEKLIFETKADIFNDFSVDEKYKVDSTLLRFFYNVQYKGMLMDGGYYNNIPYNYFREINIKDLPENIDAKSRKEAEMKGILALKLDNSFPPEFIYDINQKLTKYKTIEKELKELIFMSGDNSLIEGKTDQLNLEYEKIVIIVKNAFIEYFGKQDELINNETKDKSFKSIRKLILQFKDRNAINKIIDQWLYEYGESNEVTPWSERKSILATAMEGYSYGTERGQIRDISDHNHIIPLYDFGVGVYDFDMSKVRPMIELAKHKSEEHVNNFFKVEGEK